MEILGKNLIIPGQSSFSWFGASEVRRPGGRECWVWVLAVLLCERREMDGPGTWAAP